MAPLPRADSAASMTARISSKFRPTSLPFPDIVSRRTVVEYRFFERMRASIPEMSAIPSSAPCPTWLPGWKLYIAPGVSSSRSRSSAITLSANSLTRGSAPAALRVYGAWARIGPIAFSSAYLRNAATSFLSIGFAAPPRGFLVKNWNTFAPIETAVCAMARYPPEALK